MQKMHLGNAYRNCIFSAAVCRYDFLLQAKPLLPGAMRQFWHVMLKLRFLFNYVIFISIGGKSAEATNNDLTIGCCPLGWSDITLFFKCANVFLLLKKIAEKNSK